MNIIIIEDESLVAEDLSVTLTQLRPGTTIQAILGSVSEGKTYFESNPQPDLIFSDIQLGDGLSFEIFRTIPPQSPVIFCTAFDEYALEAFRANGIDYILKPFSPAELLHALEKYEAMRKRMAGTLDKQYAHAMDVVTSTNPATATMLVKFRERFLPIAFSKIALFYLENEITYLYTFTGRTYCITETLEELEKKAGFGFFRMNRQYLVSRQAIIDAEAYESRKLAINLNCTFNKKIIVSKERKKKVMEWLVTQPGS